MGISLKLRGFCYAGSHALQAQLQKEEEEAARRKLELEATREDRIFISKQSGTSTWTRLMKTGTTDIEKLVNNLQTIITIVVYAFFCTLVSNKLLFLLNGTVGRLCSGNARIWVHSSIQMQWAFSFRHLKRNLHVGRRWKTNARDKKNKLKKRRSTTLPTIISSSVGHPKNCKFLSSSHSIQVGRLTRRYAMPQEELEQLREELRRQRELQEAKSVTGQIKVPYLEGRCFSGPSVEHQVL